MANVDDYSAILALVGLANLERQAISLSRTLDADGAPAQASLVRQAFFSLLAELKTIAATTAAEARSAIVEAEQASRVRPDGGSQLSDWIGQSDPIPTVEGSVGINNEAVLAQSPVFWWAQHEEGYSGFVGRKVLGFFEPGHARPSRDQSRVHPIFEPDKKGGQMTIENPIPARRFVLEGYEEVKPIWHSRVQAARASFIAECRAAVAAAPPPVPRGQKGRRGPRRP